MQEARATHARYRKFNDENYKMCEFPIQIFVQVTQNRRKVDERKKLHIFLQLCSAQAKNSWRRRSSNPSKLVIIMSATRLSMCFHCVCTTSIFGCSFFHIWGAYGHYERAYCCWLLDLLLCDVDLREQIFKKNQRGVGVWRSRVCALACVCVYFIIYRDFFFVYLFEIFKFVRPPNITLHDSRSANETQNIFKKNLTKTN